ncbi:zinc-ribbon domain-containing protein [Companilactobacillus furfuricola]|uniref:zinc-ribbon domain-containing protein n=1 Tax=Companilactobacillus furfuricola TaxID=1462575 RepID=UPI000F7B6249|nr:zinc-ribbon domain-containing protein [Companilactobacillus furfuricola]
MKFCGNCGAKIPDGIKFCPKCGTPVDKFEKQLNNNEHPAENVVNQTQQQTNIQNTQNNSQAPHQNGQFQGQMNNQNQQPNANGQFQN